MSKLLKETVQVYQATSSTISAFIWRRRLYRVESIFSWWREPSEWWNGEPPRFFVRLNARNGSTSTFELCKLGKDWFLSRILD